MKRIIKFFVFVAAAAMTLASCQKNEIAGPVNKEVRFTIKADAPQTKTAITDNGDKTYTPTWANGDEIGVLFALAENAKPVKFKNTADAGKIATFEGKNTFVTNDEGTVEGNMYAFYPESAFIKVYNGGEVRLDLKNIQNPTSTSFDPSCDLLIAKPYFYRAVATGESVEVHVDDMYFARMMSVLRINLMSEFLTNETVKSVSFYAEGVRFTGAMRFNLETGEFVGNQSTASPDLSEVKAVYKEDPIVVGGQKNSAYLVVAPVTIPSETTLTFTIETEKYDIVKTVSAPSDMVMPAGNIAVINLNIKEEDCTVKTEDTSDFSGEWLIVNTDLTKAASKWVDGKNNLSSVDLTSIEGVVYESDNLADCKMTITKVTEGENAGCYTIQDASNRYLYAASTRANRLNARQDVSYWDITEKDGIYTIKSKENTTRNWMRFNNSDNIFNCYSSGQQDITLYKYSDIKPDTNPSVSVTETTSPSIGAEGGDLTFTCTIKNLDGETLEVVEESEYLTWSVAENVVTITVAANEAADSRTLNATIKCGSIEVPVTINQAGKPAEGESGWIATSFVNLKEGDQVVIVSTKGTSNLAMSNDKGTGAAPAAVSGVSYSNDKLDKEPESNIIWYVGVDGSNRIFYAKEDKTTWAYCTATNNGVRVGTNNNKAFSYTDNYLFNISTSRYIGVYNGQDWRCYTSINNNITGQTFQFFVKSSNTGGSGETTDPTPDPEPENPGDGGETPTPDQPTGAAIDFTFTSNSSVTKDGVTVTFAKGTGQSAPAWNSSQLRLYANNTIVVSSATKTLTKIEYVFVKQNGKDWATASGDATYTSGGESTGETNQITDIWTGSSKQITLTLGPSGRRVLKSIKVYTN